MGRDVLRVDGVSAETKRALQEEALRRYGKANASHLVRELIALQVDSSTRGEVSLSMADAGDTVRVEIRLPRAALEEIDARAEARFSSRSPYLVGLVMAHLGQPQLQPAEIEVLRSSNYELSKIGTNLNQLARAFNQLLQGVDVPIPETGKKIASLRRVIQAHISKVLRVLEAGTVVHETAGHGRGQLKKKRGRKSR